MDVSADPYELKLLQMFQSCDTNKCGLLDETELRRLCGLLELRDKGSILIADLVNDINIDSKIGISFERFKQALLNFLGTESDGIASPISPISSTYTHISPSSDLYVMDTYIKERSLAISDEVLEVSTRSSSESSEREVSPKLIMGTKKYGRRSRPHVPTELPPSDSERENVERLGDLKDCNANNTCSYHNKTVQRSSSQTDIAGTRRHRNPITSDGSKLKRCLSLPAQRNFQYFNSKVTNTTSQNVSIHNKSAQIIEDDVKFSQQQHKLSSSTESLDRPHTIETLSMQSIIDTWERANITNGKSILLALGFDDDDEEINLVQLNTVLEEEMRNLEGEPQVTLLRAILVIQSTELTTLRQIFRQLHEENIKLRMDNKDSNHRLAMLAAEIDERHAALEEANKKEIKLLEQRHAGIIRELTSRMQGDREHWTSLISCLENRIKCFQQEEIKFKSEIDTMRRENVDMAKDQKKYQKQVTELLENNIKLSREITDLESGTKCEELVESENNKNSEDEFLCLIEKISALQIENTNLRDKNDELVAEVENLNTELARMKVKSKKAINMSTIAVIGISDENCLLEETDSSMAVAAATKRRGDSPSKTSISQEESPRLGKLRKCADEATDNNIDETNAECIALNSELQLSGTDAEITNKKEEMIIKTLQKKIEELEESLKGNSGTSVDTNNTVERCKELESSLEQMQHAYEDCEDYWQLKLSEERQLFEKERQIYEDEQQESDRKFTELMEKVREYEEQFNKDGRLSPIEEKDNLEQQYADLEAEAVELRENAQRTLEEKTKEIKKLQKEIEDLRMRLGESVEILTGASELTNDVADMENKLNKHNSANSPINYLWQQSTIHGPSKQLESSVSPLTVLPTSPSKQINCNNLSTSETTIFSTTPVEIKRTVDLSNTVSVLPIQKPINHRTIAIGSEGDVIDYETSSILSGESFRTRSIPSTHHSDPLADTQNRLKADTKQENGCSSPNSIKDELKRLKCYEISLKDQVKDLALQRDSLVMELQQLQEARPVLEKAYVRTSHPSLIQRVNQVELRNRHLQNVIKQQQHYTESLLQQSWRQHQVELSEIHNRVEAQSVILTEQAQRLQNADLLVKDLYVENAHLTSMVQRLEQQQLQMRTRATIIHQQYPTLNGLSEMQ